jgi:dihydropteroate synthase
VDPGIGFGKNLEQNLALIKHAGELASLAPVMLGVSRKSFLGKISADGGPEERLNGSLALAAWAGFVGLDILRVHDVAETKKVLAALSAVAGAR